MTYYDVNYRRLLPADLEAPILDLGCGQGDFTRYLHGLGYRNITAVDRDADAIAQLNGLDGVKPIHASVDAQFLKGLKGKWALIIAKQMLYYFDRREVPVFVRAMAEALAKDGRLVVEIFNGALLSSRFTELKDPAILTAYTENGLARLLEANGLRVEELDGARSGGGGIYRALQAIWFKLYRGLLILERGRDDELPRIAAKSIIAVARRA
jgi:2-polyprenyl-3-methyl-5-hydroxy-6-metoxy-1,4-benzoquinol methylase